MGHFLCFYKKENVIFLTKKSPLRLSLGPTWFMVPILIIFFSYSFYLNAKLFTNPYQIFIMLILLIQVSIRLILVAITDPGYVLEEEDDDVERSIVCTRCQMHVPPNSEHCQDCGLCVQNRDHHCFWIGKCVGASNLSHFSNFCLSVVVYFVYMIVTRFPFVQRFIENIYKYDCLLEILLIIYNRLLLINRIRIYNFYIIILVN